MNLLLLLSALLSALTGVGSTGRAPADAHAASSIAVTAVEAVAETIAVAVRPVQGRASLATTAAAPAFVMLVPVPAVPLYAARRRE